MLPRLPFHVFAVMFISTDGTELDLFDPQKKKILKE